MTSPTPDLQRIMEALKACRERYVVWGGSSFPATRCEVRSSFDHKFCFAGTRDECLAYIDARCAEAMVRAIREPGEAIKASQRGHWKGDFVYQWARACDAILGETQP